MKKTLVDLFEGAVKHYPDHPFLWEKTKDRFEPTTYSEVQKQVYRLGAGWVALGIRKGDHIALLSEGRNAWIVGELAMFYAGAVNVPLSIKLEEANDLLFRLLHADVCAILVSGNQLKKIRRIKDRLPAVQKIIVLDEQPDYQEKEIPLAEAIRLGEKWLQTHSLRAIASKRRLRHHHLYVRHDCRSERRDSHPPQLYGQRRAVAFLHRHRLDLAHLGDSAVRPLFRPRRRFLYLYVQRSFCGDGTSRENSDGNPQKHSGEH